MSASVLGKGAYGSVKIVNNNAVKTFHKLPHIIQEFAALEYLKDCQHVVHAKSLNLDNLELVMELYPYSFRKYMTDDDCCCCEECLNIIFKDILLGLVELHDRQLSHSDLKPGNILISKEPLKAVLGDCGFVSLANYSKQQRTARSYRDIEVVNDLMHDMFSLGVMILELYYHVRPEERHSYEAYQKIINKKVKDRKHKSILRKLMIEKRESRLTARQVLKIWFNVSPPPYQYNKDYDFIKIQQELYKKYDVDLIKSMELNVKANYKELDILRSKTGVKALMVYLHKHRVIPEKYLKFYLCATLIIVSSLFGNKSPYIPNFLIVCDMPEQNKKRLLQVIDQLLHDDLFLSVLFH